MQSELSVEFNGVLLCLTTINLVFGIVRAPWRSSHGAPLNDAHSLGGPLANAVDDSQAANEAHDAPVLDRSPCTLADVLQTTG
jgi:hypothetical protein